METEHNGCDCVLQKECETMHIEWRFFLLSILKSNLKSKKV